MTSNRALVTGASGFLAIHIVKILLERGYSVVGTVRSQSKAEYLHNIFKGLPFETTLVEDIGAPGAFDKVFQNDKKITNVLHTASPMNTPKVDPAKEVLEPALYGVRNILTAIKAYAPQVTKVVFTSSFVATCDMFKLGDKTYSVDEASFSPVTWEEAATDTSKTYYGSKVIAEKEFWRFIKEENPNFKGTALLPPFIFGPSVNSSTIIPLNNSSKMIFKHIFDNQGPDFDYKTFTSLFVDVRDIALAHVLSLEKPELEGERLFVTSGFSSTQVFLDSANKNFPELKGKIAVGKPGTGLDYVPHIFTFNKEKSDKLLNIKYRSIENTIVDTFTDYLSVWEKEQK